jgi:transposase-like protein
MSEKQDLRSRLVVGRKRDGRREYDDAARDELVQLCLQPGVSIARTAMEHDLNPNLLRSWVRPPSKDTGPDRARSGSSVACNFRRRHNRYSQYITSIRANRVDFRIAASTPA